MTESKLFYQYQLRGLLGENWLGPVHTAHDLDEGNDVALRILRPEVASQSFLVMQLERLLLRVAALRHTHLLPTNVPEQREGQVFYTSALAVRGSVRQLLQRQARGGQPLPLVIAVELIRQAASGLAYAHQQGLMHGNLKPENLLLQPGRSLLGFEGYSVQLADFGLAELQGGVFGTHDRALLGAPAYASPEQTRGIRNDLRTDIYGLGLILYELVTGMVPFEIRDAADAIEKHQHVAPRRPALSREDLPEALEEVILTCLAKQPADRYQTGEELEAALQAVLNHLLPSGPEPTVRLPTLPVLPPPPKVPDNVGTGQPRLLIYSERHELVREQLLPGTFTVGRAPDSSVLLDHIGVSRHHLSGELTDGGASITELSATNGTMMDGLPLTPMTRLRWPYGTLVYLRPFWLLLAGPQSVRLRSRIVVRPGEERIHLVPGTPAPLSVTLVNTGETVDHFRLTLEGIPETWVQGMHQEVQLNPGTQTQATLTLLAPRESASRAGNYPVTVFAHSRQNPAEHGEAPLQVDVAAFHEISAKLRPAERRTWRRTTFTLEVENQSNTEVSYLPRVRNDAGEWNVKPRLEDFASMPAAPNVGTTVDPTLLARQAAQRAAAQARTTAQNAASRVLRGEGRMRVEDLSDLLTLEAGQVHREELKVRVPIRWLGSASQHLLDVEFYRPEQLDAEGVLQGSPATRAQGKVHHLPLLPMWLLLLLLLLLAILLWWLLRLPQIDRFGLKGTDTAVRPGQKFTLTWETTNAHRVEILELPQSRLKRDGDVVVPGIKREQRYTLVASSLIGRKRQAEYVVTPRYDRPEIQVFTVSKDMVGAGKPVTVTWKVRNAETIEISPFGRVKEAQGSRTFTPLRDTKFEIVARNGTESDEASQTVQILGPKIKVFRLENPEIVRGGTTRLLWDVENASKVSISAFGEVSPRGERPVAPKQNTTYTIQAVNASGTSVTDTAPLTVQVPAPQVTLKVSPQAVLSDGKIRINWTSTNASRVSIEYGSGVIDGGPSGERVVDAPPESATVTATAYSDDGQQATATTPLQVTYVDRAAEATAASARLAQQQRATQLADERRRAREITFTASPDVLHEPGTVQLQWDAPGFRSVDILPLNGTQPDGTFPPTGNTQQEKVSGPRTYTLRIILLNGEQIRIPRKVRYEPYPPELRSFTASPDHLTGPGDVVLSWQVEHVKRVRISGLPGPSPDGTWPAQGSTTVKLGASRTFVLTASRVTASQPVQVTIPQPQIGSFIVTPQKLTAPGNVTLNWQVSNIDRVFITGLKGTNPDGSWPAQGTTSVPVSRSREFELRAGEKVQRQPVTVTLAPAQPVVRMFTATPSQLTGGGQVKLGWQVSNVRSVRIDGVKGPNLDGSWPAQGSTSLQVLSTRTFTLRAGQKSRQASVTVNPLPVTIQQFEATPRSLTGPRTVLLVWKVSGVQFVRITGPGLTPPVSGLWPANGSAIVNVTRTSSFTLTANGQSRTAQVVVSAPVPVLRSIKVTPDTVTPGQKAVLSWAVQGALTVRIDGVPGNLPAAGSREVTPQDTTIYTLHAGSAVESVTLTVQPPVSKYADLAGTWQHPMGEMRINPPVANRATGNFISQRQDILDIPINIVFTGDSFTASSPELQDFKLIGVIEGSRKVLRGTYSLRKTQERWCGYRPGMQPDNCQ